MKKFKVTGQQKFDPKSLKETLSLSKENKQSFYRSLVFSLGLILFASLSITTVFALNAAPAPESSAAAETDTNESIKNRLQQVVQERKNQIQGVTSEGQMKRGFVAHIKRVSEESITVETRQGPLIIPLNDNLVILDGNSEADSEDLEIDMEVTVMGLQNGENFEAKRMLIHEDPLVSEERFIEIGTLTAIDRQSVTIQTRQGEEKIYALNRTIAYEDNAGQTLRVNQIEEDQSIVILFLPEDANNQSVKDSAGKVFRLRTLSVNEQATPTTAKTTTPAADDDE